MFDVIVKAHPPLHSNSLLSEFHFTDIVFKRVDHQVMSAVGAKLRSKMREKMGKFKWL